MGNSSSQVEEVPGEGGGTPSAAATAESKRAGHHHHRITPSRDSSTFTPSHSQSDSSASVDHFPPVPPQGFEQRLPPLGTTTTSVTKESATVSPPGGSGHQRESSFHHEEFAHEEHVGKGSSTSERPALRRKSTILLDEPAEMDEEEMELSKLRLTDELKPLSRAGSGEEVVLSHEDKYKGNLFNTVIEWKQGGSKVYVTGTFTGWRRMIKLSKVDDEAAKQTASIEAVLDTANATIDLFSVILRLPRGTHRLRFVVDNEMRCSDYLPTATDSMGNLVNYIEVGVEDGLPQAATGTATSTTATTTAPDDESGGVDDEYEKFNEDDEALHEPVLQYGNEIPAVFTDPEVMDRFVSSDFVTPPQLPPHLESVILNSNSTEKDNNSILPIPNHVVLNHLATTSIKHNVLAVASISRYSRKYVTQILYAPL